LLKELFDLTKQEDDYLEIAYNIWRAIGNIATCTHAFEFEITEDGLVHLPCNVEFIEAVAEHIKWVDKYGDSVSMFHAEHNWKIYPNHIISDVLQRNIAPINLDSHESQLKPLGEYINYELTGSPGQYTLRFDKRYAGIKAICIYRGILMDQYNNPLLHRKEAEAIAYQMAFLDTQKKAFKRDPAAANLLAYIKPEANLKMAAAKVPEYITQNNWNRVLSAMTRHDRKVYWSSYKLMS